MSKRCAKCGKTVYPVEELKCLEKVWHKNCFRCQVCNMQLTMKNYKGFDKLPYCAAHVPKAKATVVADTPENKRLAENTKVQSNVQYHADFEASKGKFTQVADDPETMRLKANTEVISNIAYHDVKGIKDEQEKKRSLQGGGENKMTSSQESDFKVPDQIEERRPQPAPSAQSAAQQLHSSSSRAPAGPPGPPASSGYNSSAHQPQSRSTPSNYSQQPPPYSNPPHQPQHSQQRYQQQMYQQQQQQLKEQQMLAQQQQLKQQQMLAQQQEHLKQQQILAQQQQQRKQQQMYLQQQQQQQQQQRAQYQQYGRSSSQGYIQQSPAQYHQHNNGYQQSMGDPRRSHSATSYPAGQAQPHPSGRVSQGTRCYRAMYDYESQDVDEVSFKDGDIIINATFIDEGWMTGTVHRTGQAGMLPANYVEPVNL